MTSLRFSWNRKGGRVAKGRTGTRIRFLPDREIFEHVLRETGLSGDGVLFLDDNALNVEGAQAAGLDAHLALGVEGARTILAEAGVLA